MPGAWAKARHNRTAKRRTPAPQGRSSRYSCFPPEKKKVAVATTCIRGKRAAAAPRRMPPTRIRDFARLLLSNWELSKWDRGHNSLHGQQMALAKRGRDPLSSKPDLNRPINQV